MADPLKNANGRTGFSGLSAIPDDPPPFPPPAKPKATASPSPAGSGAWKSPPPPSQPTPPPLGTYQPPVESDLAKALRVVLQRVRRVFDSLLAIAFGIFIVLGTIGLFGVVGVWLVKPQPVAPPAAELEAPQRATPDGAMGAGRVRNTDIQSPPTDSVSLPQSNSPNDGGNGATYRVPQSRLAEVDAAKSAAEHDRAF